jgi:hypothetical protein
MMKTTIAILSLCAFFACLSFSAQAPLPATVTKTPRQLYDPLQVPSSTRSPGVWTSNTSA